MNPAPQITGLYAARPSVLEPSGQRSAILKVSRSQVTVTRLGIVGDEQADRRYHGGEDKALHQYTIANYARIVAAYPALAGIAVPGSIGENLSCPDLSEETVCIGDCYRLGSVEVQITQPRSPCSKIDARYQVSGLAKQLAGWRVPGWYLRVLQEGQVAVGDEIRLLARPNPTVTIARFLAVTSEHRPATETLLELASAVGLAAEWQRRLRERSAYRA